MALTHALAVSLGPAIRVNAVAPGWIETGHLQGAEDEPYPEHSEADRMQHPAGRVGRPEDVAEAVAWLVSPRSGYVSGDVITVDGGETAGLMVSENEA